MRTSLVVAFAVQAAAALLPIDARHVTLSAPATIATVSRDAVKGEPARLAWSPDAGRLYLQCAKSDRWGNRTVFHFEIAAATGAVKAVDREPEWSGRYWAWKSAPAAPASPDFRIASETLDERRTAVGIANAGAMAQSGGDPSLGSELGPQGAAIASHLLQGQMVRTTTLRLKGQLLGEFVNTAPNFGLTFGWAPAGMDAVAYSNTKGHLVIMDRAGHRREVAGTDKVLLPAWSQDGSRLAWVERPGSKQIVLRVVVVGR